MKICLLQGQEVTSTIFSKTTINELRKIGEVVINQEDKPTDEHVKKLIKNANIVITSWGNDLLTKEILDNAPDIKLIVHAAGSVKPILSKEIIKREIPIANNAKVLGKGVAETTLGLTITSVKNIFYLNQQTTRGNWIRKPIREMVDLSIGVIGAGWVGKHYIKLLQSFDVDVLLYDPTLTDNQVSKLGATKVELNKLLTDSDVISIHAPAIDETYHLLNYENLSLLKDGAILINTARGSIIDEKDLLRILQEKNIFACIDVTDPEPPSENHPFRQLDNVILTPHIAGLAGNGKLAIGKNTVNIIKRFLNNEKIDEIVNIENIDNLA